MKTIHAQRIVSFATMLLCLTCNADTAETNAAADARIEQVRILSERVTDLTGDLAAANVRIAKLSSPRGTGKLHALERKARERDVFQARVKTSEATIAGLMEQLAVQQKHVDAQASEILGLRKETNELSVAIQNIKEEVAPLKQALDVIRFGNYEYYTVLMGDTCRSIAAEPMIYGDPAKHSLIRQANRTNVADLDALAPGEVLIIPRLRGGSGL